VHAAADAATFPWLIIDIDPAITQKDTAKQAIREMIRANADVLPLFKH
jgi:hypothetical protein